MYEFAIMAAAVISATAAFVMSAIVVHQIFMSVRRRTPESKTPQQQAEPSQVNTAEVRTEDCQAVPSTDDGQKKSFRLMAPCHGDSKSPLDTCGQVAEISIGSADVGVRCSVGKKASFFFDRGRHIERVALSEKFIRVAALDNVTYSLRYCPVGHSAKFGRCPNCVAAFSFRLTDSRLECVSEDWSKVTPKLIIMEDSAQCPKVMYCGRGNECHSVRRAAKLLLKVGFDIVNKPGFAGDAIFLSSETSSAFEDGAIDHIVYTDEVEEDLQTLAPTTSSHAVRSLIERAAAVVDSAATSSGDMSDASSGGNDNQLQDSTPRSIRKEHQQHVANMNFAANCTLCNNSAWRLKKKSDSQSSTNSTYSCTSSESGSEKNQQLTINNESMEVDNGNNNETANSINNCNNFANRSSNNSIAADKSDGAFFSARSRSVSSVYASDRTSAVDADENDVAELSDEHDDDDDENRSNCLRDELEEKFSDTFAAADTLRYSD